MNRGRAPGTEATRARKSSLAVARGAAPIAVKVPVKRRLDPDKRKELILQQAVDLFGRTGFSSSLRDLAEEAGVSTGLIIKYFGTKEELLNVVFNEVFMSRWEEARLEALKDTAVPLRDRLAAFYSWFFDITDDYNWIRSGIFSGLMGTDLSRWHFEVQVKRIIDTVARQIVDTFELGRNRQITLRDKEVAWHLHSTFIQYLVRDHVYGRPVWRDKQATVALVVGMFVDGVGSVYGEGSHKPGV